MIKLEDLKINRGIVEFDSPIALVLSGGGGKGAYEIGAWKALVDCGVKIGGVYGTSVGALNAAGVAMGDFEKARDVWLNMDQDMVIDQSPEFKKLLDTVRGKSRLVEKFRTVKKILSDTGIDVTPLRREVESLISEEMVRESGIDLGVVTYSITEMKPKLMLLEDIPRGKLVDYIMASANYPIFRREEIDSKKFIDGGVYRNIPLDMAKKRGFKNIVVVQIGGKRIGDTVSLLASMFTKDFKIVRIKPRVFFGGPMDFDKEISRKFLIEGYLDTLCNMKLAWGNYTYIFDQRDCIGKMFFSLDNSSRKTAMEILGIKKEETDGSHYFYYKQFLPVFEDHLGTLLPEETASVLIDSLAELYEVESLKLYSFKELIGLVLNEFEKAPEKIYGVIYNDIPAYNIVKFLGFLYERRSSLLETTDEYEVFKKNIEHLLNDEQDI